MITLSRMITYKKVSESMKDNTVTAMMHPLRIRIIQELALKHTATTKELLHACGDIPQATLYRHLKELLSYNIIKVSQENTINGIIEKVYAINDGAMSTIMKDPTTITKDDLTSIFNQFMISLMTDFKSYIDHEDGTSHLQHDFGLVSASLFLSDDELKEMLLSIDQVMSTYLENQPSDDRKLRKFSRIITTSK